MEKGYGQRRWRSVGHTVRTHDVSTGSVGASAGVEVDPWELEQDYIKQTLGPKYAAYLVQEALEAILPGMRR